MNLFDFLREALPEKKIRVVLPDLDERTIIAALNMKKEGRLHPVLIGQSEDLADEQDENFTLIDPLTSEEKGELVNHFYDVRKHSGISVGEAWEVVSDPLVFGALMVMTGQADSMVAGLHTGLVDLMGLVLSLYKPKQRPAHLPNGILLCREGALEGEDDSMVFLSPGNDGADCTEAAAEEIIALLDFYRPMLPGKWMLAVLPEKMEDGSDGEKAFEKVLARFRKRLDDIDVLGPVSFEEAYHIGEARKVFLFPEESSRNIATQVAVTAGGFRPYGPFFPIHGKPLGIIGGHAKAQTITETALLTASLAVKPEKTDTDLQPVEDNSTLAQ